MWAELIEILCQFTGLIGTRDAVSFHLWSGTEVPVVFFFSVESRQQAGRRDKGIIALISSSLDDEHRDLGILAQTGGNN